MKFLVFEIVFIMLAFCLKGQDSDTLKFTKPLEIVIQYGGVIDNPPRFNHPEFADFRNWIYNELNKDQNSNKCFGNSDLMVYFTVTSAGQVKDIDVLQKKPGMVSNKSHRMTVGCVNFITSLVESSSPFWIGGTNIGTPISVKYNFPIEFK
jgi:hypothetical protein